MNSCILVLSLAVFGASAAPCAVSSCNTALPGPTTFGQAPFVENPANVIPPYVPSGSVSQSCHCMKTIVRPQIRNEIITAPSVDRIVRYVTNPTYEVATVHTGGNTRAGAVPTCTTVGGVFPGAYGYNGVVGNGLVGNGIVGAGLVGNGVVGSGLVGTGLVGGCNTGLVGTGLVGGCNTGLVGTGLVGGYNTGLVGGYNGVVGTGLVGGCNTGLVGAGVVGGCGCGSNIVV